MLIVVFGVLATASVVRGDPVEDALPRDPASLLQTAFDRMFNYPSVRTVRLNIHRKGRRVTRRGFQVAYKKIDGRGKTLLRFTEPEYLRGNALLIVERGDGTNDAWLYQDTDRRVRRVSTHQRADTFYGSDLTFEDLEHHDWSRFHVRWMPESEESGRPCYTLSAVPRLASQYSKVVAWIEKEHLALLRVDFFRGDSQMPAKSLMVPPDEIAEEDGILKPARFWMRQRGREASTEVEFLEIESDPHLTDTMFSAMRIERSGLDLFKLGERLRDEDQSPP